MFRFKSNFLKVFSGLAILCGAIPAASATMLGGTLTADNGLFAYLSTSPNTLGPNLLASSNTWGKPVSFQNIVLAPNTTYYLNIEVMNSGNQGGFLGQLSLSDTNAQFSNGTQTLLTNAVNWSGGYNDSYSGTQTAPYTFSYTVQPWVTPTGGTVALGNNGMSPWGNLSTISSSSQWIWASGANAYVNNAVCATCTIDLSTTITTFSAPTQSASVISPASLGLLFLGVGLLVVLKKRSELA